MTILRNSRRGFILKSALLTGMFTFAKSTVFANLTKEPVKPHVRLFHGNGSFDTVQDIFSKSTLNTAPNIFVGNGSIWCTDDKDELLGKSEYNLKFSLDFLRSRRESKYIPRVNSRRWIDSTSVPDKNLKNQSLTSFEIVESSGLRIGLMGVGFDDSSLSLSGTIHTMNEISRMLKHAKGCDLIYCLTDCPNQIFPYFSVRELAENSLCIDHFFVSLPNSKENRLFVLRNQEGGQVLLSQKNAKDESLDVVEVGGADRLSIYQL